MASVLVFGIAFNLWAPSLQAFSGSGSREYRLGLAYLHFSGQGRGASAALRGHQLSEAREMSEIERYEQAIEHLENAAASSPSQSEQERVERAIRLSFNRLSLQYSNQGDKERAAENAQRALEYDEDNAVLWYNLASYQDSLGRSADSLYSFEKALELASDSSMGDRIRRQLVSLLIKRSLTEDDDHMYRALSLIEDGLYENPRDEKLLYQKAFAHYQLGDFHRAIEAFDDLKEVRELTKGETSLYQEAKNRLNSINERGEVVEERAGFVISFDPEINEVEELRRAISNFLVEARDHISPVFGFYEDTRINVYVQRAQEFQEVHGRRPIAGTCRLNRIDLRIRPGLSTKELKNTVFHEFTHYLVTALTKARKVPVWFNEGLAQNFECSVDWRKETIRGILLYNSRRQLSIEDIEGISSLGRKDFFTAYLQSFFQLHCLIELNGESRMIKILAKVGSGKSFDEAFESVLGKGQEAFFKAWRGLFKDMLLRLKDRHVPDWEAVKKKLRERAGGS